MPASPAPFSQCSKTIVGATASNVLQKSSQRRILRHAHNGLAFATLERTVRLRSLNEQIDTTTPQGLMMFHVFSIIAQFERDLIADRTRAGLEAARASGRSTGRRRPLAPSQITQVQTWLAFKQMTQAQPAKALGVSRASLIRALSSAKVLSK